MPDSSLQWQLPSGHSTPPSEWVAAVRALCPTAAALPLHHVAQLLWQRGLRQLDQLQGFLDPHAYQPTSPFAFGSEMIRAAERLIQAWSGTASKSPEKVAIWGDFDADGVTATAVLWEGLKPLFPPGTHLRYYIPHRFTESHGLSFEGLNQLSEWGCQLLVTCDTGSTNLAEIEYAYQLGMDVIVTDHHTLPEQRPPVVAIVNPRALPSDHPLRTLSGVAVAYKLIEALYQSLPEPPTTGLESLLDLVSIGLIADLVELTGDCRYLAQRGLEQLQSQLHGQPSRPGIAELLTLCKRTGDRPTDISFGIGPRINAISRIHGDAHFCIELLTSQDRERCHQLALEAELANTRRKALQRDLLQQVKTRINQIDLATTAVLVLADEQWPPGILGLVAGQVAQLYGRPTLLLSLDPPDPDHPHPPRLARGSARSVPGLDLYALFKTQDHLLSGYGGHPLAAGLSLPVENVPLLTAALNRQVRQLQGEQPGASGPALTIDLTVTVADLGQDLFRALKLLEPYGMGNPVPRLLIQNCWVSGAWHRRIKDQLGGQVAFIRTEFKLWDETVQAGFSGEWWDHYADDLPQGRFDAVVELDFNTIQKQYLVRLIAVRPIHLENSLSPARQSETILDWRLRDQESGVGEVSSAIGDQALVITQCPTDWSEWAAWMAQAATSGRPLAMAYAPPTERPARETWQQFLGLAKYLARTGERVSLERLQERLQLTPPTLSLGLQCLASLGFNVVVEGTGITIQAPAEAKTLSSEVFAFLDAVQEEQFRRRYFYQIPVSTLSTMGSLA